MREILDEYLEKYNNEINIVAHVGAHLGQEVNTYLQLDIEKIYLFEPLKNIFKDLKNKHGKDERIAFYNFALGANSFRTYLNISLENEGQSSSILKPNLHLRDKKEITFKKSDYEIDVKRFDSLGLKSPHFINIDAQGYELEVLKGFGDSLETSKLICCEVNRDLTYQDNALIKEIDIYLKKFSFVRVSTKWGKYNETYGLAAYLKRDLVQKKNITLITIFNKFHYMNIYFFLRNFTNYKRFKNTLKKLLSKLRDKS